MVTVRIDDTWDFTVDPATAEGWFLDHVLRTPTKMGKHLSLGAEAFEAVAPVLPPRPRVVEFFGGIGGNALELNRRLNPRAHTVYENSPTAVAHLRELGIPLDVREADAYAARPSPANLVVVDMGDFTAHKFTRERYRALLDHVFFGMDPDAVTVTDIAGAYHHMHKESYTEVVGPHDTYPEYLRGLASTLATRYGYWPVEVVYQRATAVLAFTREPVTLFPIERHLPDIKSRIEIVE